MSDPAPPDISLVSPDRLDGRIADFAALMRACVLGGAAINFVAPFSEEESLAFWRDTVAPGVRSGRRLLWAAEIDGWLAGSAQLDLAWQPNQPHRAEVTKLLTDPAWRRRGVGRALMLALEGEARRIGRTLLTLDTTTGGPAEPLYLSLGYQVVGQIPDFSRAVFEDRLEATTVMCKRV